MFSVLFFNYLLIIGDCNSSSKYSHKGIKKKNSTQFRSEIIESFFIQYFYKTEFTKKMLRLQEFNKKKKETLITYEIY